MFNKDVTNAFASGMPENELKKIHKDFMEALNVLSGNKEFCDYIIFYVFAWCVSY